MIRRGELIHDDQYPVSQQHSRFATKQVYAPKTVLSGAKERQPGWAASVWLSIMFREDTPHDIRIDGYAECHGNLLSDSRTSPEWIARFGGDKSHR
jgi:hypothetical protein